MLVISPWFFSFGFLSFHCILSLLGLHFFMFYCVAFANSFTHFVLQNILRLFPLSSVSTRPSSLHVWIFFLGAASSFILNLNILLSFSWHLHRSFSGFNQRPFYLLSHSLIQSFLLILFVFICDCFLLLFYFISWLLLLPSFPLASLTASCFFPYMFDNTPFFLSFCLTA